MGAFRLTLLVFVLAALVPAIALPQAPCPTRNRTKAVSLGKEARALLDQRSFDEAMERLRAAYALCPEPWVFQAMGRVQEAAGNLKDALASFRSCEREAADPTLGQDCHDRAEAIEARLKAPPPAPEPPVVAAPATPAPVAEKPTPAAPQPVQEPPPPPPRRPTALWNWVGVGVSAALLVTGVTCLGLYGRDRAEAHSSPWVDSQGHTHEPDTVHPTNAIVGGIATGLGVAGLLVSILTWPKASVSAAKGGAMVSVSGAW